MSKREDPSARPQPGSSRPGNRAPPKPGGGGGYRRRPRRRDTRARACGFVQGEVGLDQCLRLRSCVLLLSVGVATSKSSSRGGGRQRSGRLPPKERHPALLPPAWSPECRTVWTL